MRLQRGQRFSLPRREQGAVGTSCTEKGFILMQEIEFLEWEQSIPGTTLPGMWSHHRWRFSRCSWTRCQIISSRLPPPTRSQTTGPSGAARAVPGLCRVDVVTGRSGAAGVWPHGHGEQGGQEQGLLRTGISFLSLFHGKASQASVDF